MALSKAIFNQPPSFGQDDIVGRVRSGTQDNGRPVALQQWRFTLGDPALAKQVAAQYGGTPQPWETKTDEALEIFSTVETLAVTFEDIFAEMTLWGRSKPIRSCDGVFQTDDAKTPCACPADFAERKVKAKEGSACQPNIKVRFRLAEMPDAGIWRFTSSSWQLAAEIPDLVEDLEAHRVAGDSAGTLGLKVVEWQTKAGEDRKFTRPFIKLGALAAV